MRAHALVGGAISIALRGVFAISYILLLGLWVKEFDKICSCFEFSYNFFLEISHQCLRNLENNLKELKLEFVDFCFWQVIGFSAFCATYIERGTYQSQFISYIVSHFVPEEPRDTSLTSDLIKYFLFIAGYSYFFKSICLEYARKLHKKEQSEIDIGLMINADYYDQARDRQNRAFFPLGFFGDNDVEKYGKRLSELFESQASLRELVALHSVFIYIVGTYSAVFVLRKIHSWVYPEPPEVEPERVNRGVNTGQVFDAAALNNQGMRAAGGDNADQGLPPPYAANAQ